MCKHHNHEHPGSSTLRVGAKFVPHQIIPQRTQKRLYGVVMSSTHPSEFDGAVRWLVVQDARSGHRRNQPTPHPVSKPSQDIRARPEALSAPLECGRQPSRPAATQPKIATRQAPRIRVAKEGRRHRARSMRISTIRVDDPGRRTRASRATCIARQWPRALCRS